MLGKKPNISDIYRNAGYPWSKIDKVLYIIH